MKKVYTIEVLPWPKTYTIKAESEEEARGTARELFTAETGQGAYETKVQDIEYFADSE